MVCAQPQTGYVVRISSVHIDDGNNQDTKRQAKQKQSPVLKTHIFAKMDLFFDPRTNEKP